MEYFSPKDFSLGANFPENRDSKGEPISAKDLAEPRIRKVCVGIRWNLIRFNSLNCQNKPPMNEKSKSLLNCTSFAETTERAIVKLFRGAPARHASREQG